MTFQQDFTVAELAVRRQRLAAGLENGEIALIPGADAPVGIERFRQFNDFYYLCGVEVPHAYLLVGHRGHTTLYLSETPFSPFNPDRADWVCRITGVQAVLPISELAKRLQQERAARLPFREGEGIRMAWDSLQAWRQSVLNDPFDNRRGRNSEIVACIRERLPHLELKNLSPLLDELRFIKSDTELALLRYAGELTAKGALAAMEASYSGIREYEFHAELEYVYVKGGARGDAYAPIIPGSANAGNPHYLENQAVLVDGDVVLLDCAPDYHYYTSDIGRMWPINGVFSPAQRSLYRFVLQYHQTVLGLIAPGAMCQEIHESAAQLMRPVFERWRFPDSAHRDTAATLFDFDGHISHGVGMAVHEISLHRDRPFEPGMVFAVDPMAWDDDNSVYYRVQQR